MFDRILIPLDGTLFAEAAVPYAELIPSRAVILIRIDPPSGGIQTPGWAEHADADIARMGERFARQGRHVERMVRFGPVAQTLIEEAAGADLVIIATRGFDVAARDRPGSIADEVARNGPVPTLLVRSGPEGVAGPPICRIVLPLDGSPEAEEAVDIGGAFASDLGIPVTLVRVLPPPPTNAGSRRTATETAMAYLSNIARRLRARDLAVEIHVCAGDAATCLVAELAPTDLVILASTNPAGHSPRRSESVSDTLVQFAPAAVLFAATPKTVRRVRCA